MHDSSKAIQAALPIAVRGIIGGLMRFRIQNFSHRTPRDVVSAAEEAAATDGATGDEVDDEQATVPTAAKTRAAAAMVLSI